MLILIASGQGGIGKTTFTAELARAIAALGKKVIAVDGCCRARDLDLRLGVQDRVVYDWSDVLSGDCSFSEALVPVDDRLSLLSCPQTKEWQPSDGKHFQKLMEKAQEQADYVLFDCPAYQLSEAAFFSHLSHIILMLTDSGDSAIRKTEAAIDILNRDCDRQLVIAQSAANRYPPEVVSQILDLPLLGVMGIHQNGWATRIARKLLEPEASEKAGFLHLIHGRGNRI